MALDLVVAHSSDLHIGRDGGDRGIGGLRQVVAAARDAGADVLLLAGDIFDHNRVAASVVDAAAAGLSDAGCAVVILPGNHDPLREDAVYHRLPPRPDIHVLGLTDDAAVFPHLQLVVWGQPHTDYHDMRPLPRPGEPAYPRTVVMAHGHYVGGPGDLHRAWLIHDGDIAALGADYVALGHWDRRARVGRAGAFAYYSGSPDLARSINIARFGRNGGGVSVVARSLRDGTEMPL